MKLRLRLQLTFALYSILILSLLFLVLHLNINNSFQVYGKRLRQQGIVETLNNNLSFEQLEAQVEKYGYNLQKTNNNSNKGNATIVKDNQGISYMLTQTGSQSLNTSEQQLLDTIDSLLLILGVVFLLISQILAYFISKKFSSPVEGISKSIQDIKEGNLGKVVSCKSNITEYKQLCDTLSKMSKQLEKNRDQSRRYNQDVQHELRTPVTNLLSHLEAVQDGVFEMDENMIKDLHSEVIRLSKIIDQIQNLEKMDDGRKFVKMEIIDVNEIVGERIKSFVSSAKMNEISIETDIRVKQIVTDSSLFSTIITNLLSNSIKYAGRGSKIIISIRKENSNILISVKDNGIGIENDKLDKLFDRFYRVDNSRSRETGGSGLGLSITKASVEILNGTIEVLSTPKKETIFNILLPQDK
ncbi:MAG: HAMP domain-containing sensor histidine kinase [Sphaerochaetaceae bacterium]